MKTKEEVAREIMEFIREKMNELTDVGMIEAHAFDGMVTHEDTVSFFKTPIWSGFETFSRDNNGEIQKFERKEF